MAVLNPIGNVAVRVSQGIKKAIANKVLGLYEYYRIKNTVDLEELRKEFAFEDMACTVYSDNRKVVTTYSSVSVMCDDLGITTEEASDIIRNKNGIFGGYIMHLGV